MESLALWLHEAKEEMQQKESEFSSCSSGSQVFHIISHRLEE